MKIIHTIFFSLLILFGFSQKKAALVTTNQKQSAYINETGEVTYTESTDPAINEAICKFHNGYARIRRAFKFYFVDIYGKPIFNEGFEKAEDFEESLAEVKLDGKWGFINTKGEVAIKPQFYETHRFSEGLSEVAFGPKGKHGYIDTTGKLVIQPKFDNATPFFENKAWVSMGGKWGIIDKSGNYIIQPTYEVVRHVHEKINMWDNIYDAVDKKMNRKKKSYENIQWARLNNKWGLINRTGKVLLPPSFTDIKDIHEGYTWVKQDGLWGLIDSVGHFIIKPAEVNPLLYGKNVSYKTFSNFGNGLIRYQSRGLYGYLNEKLEVVIPAKYEEAGDFVNGLTVIKQKGNCGIIDINGNNIIPTSYKELIITGNDYFLAKNEGNDWGYLGFDNQWIIKPKFKNVSSFEPVNDK